MARIAIAGFLHETNTFAQGTTDLDIFLQADAWPGLVTGSALLEAFSGANIAISGFMEEARREGHELVPLLWASANPSGKVEQAAYEYIVSTLVETLKNAMQAQRIDAVFLDLHGAMVAEHSDDGEGELLARIRSLTGKALPIVIALDFHANISPRMAELADACVVYRTYPHVDIAETGRRAAILLQPLLAGQPLYKVYRQLPFLIPLLWQCTLTEPFNQFMQCVEEQEHKHGVSAAIVPGFPLADCYDCGLVLLAYGKDAAAVENALHTLYKTVEQGLHRLGGKLYSCEEAVAYAKNSPQPLILADTQDNPGGGGTGDTLDLLYELIHQNMENVCLGVVCDPEAARAAHAAGVGKTVALALGGRSGIGAAPRMESYTVEALGDGKFTATGSFYQGCRMDLGAMARLSYRGIHIVVSSRKQQAADQAMFRHVKSEPSDYRVLVLKSSVHFRADFGRLGREVLIVAAPGVNSAQLKHLNYTKLRPGVTVL